LLIGVYATRTVTRNFDWATNETLWLSTAETAPRNTRAMLALGQVYKGGSTEKVRNEGLKKGQVTLEPDLPLATHYLERCVDLEKAELKLAVSDHPLNHWNFFQVGVQVALTVLSIFNSNMPGRHCSNYETNWW
jgi:hypothetical protein